MSTPASVKTFSFNNKIYKAALVVSVILTHGVSSGNIYKIEVYSNQHDFTFQEYNTYDEAINAFKTIQEARGYVI